MRVRELLEIYGLTPDDVLDCEVGRQTPVLRAIYAKLTIEDHRCELTIAFPVVLAAAARERQREGER